MNMKNFLGLLIIATIVGLMAGAFHVILDELKKQNRETTIEVDGYTYQIEESKPPKTIQVDGKTYVLVTE